MKIYTITCHDCYNYGASLQAYALQRFIQNKGHDCKIIDYKPLYLDKKYKFTKLRLDEPGYWLYKKIGPLKVILALYIHKHSLWLWQRKKAFDRFTKTHLNLTQTFHSNEEIAKSLLDGDVYIAGSDQIWNTDLMNGRDPAFYIAFAPSLSKRISYAASFGISCIRKPYYDFAKELLKKFQWISVRENTGVEIVSSLGLNAVQVMDPIFLLSKDEWSALCSHKVPKEPYLLLYYLGKNNPNIQLLAQSISNKRKLKIYALNDGKRIPFADKNINNAGPEDFIFYIKNASFVLSTSFHATAFSILFGRQFFVCPLTGQQNQSRMKDLLDIFGLSDRFLISSNNSLTDINYCTISDKLEEKIIFSQNVLLSNLI